MDDQHSQAKQDKPRKHDQDSERAPVPRKPAASAEQGRNKTPPGQQSKEQDMSTPRPTRNIGATRPPLKQPAEEEVAGFFGRLSGLTSSAYRFAKRTTDGSIRVGKALIKSQDQLKLMLAAGQSLRDLREVAGLTVNELSDALNLKDKTLLEAVENGTATLSFELILRLSALLARNDPIPFILRFTRTYNPDLWKLLNDWGLGRLPLQYERERQFINIYRRRDAARKLSDQGFQHVLKFTQEAFEMALHFVAEQEKLTLEEENVDDEALSKELKKPAKQASPKERERDKGGRTDQS